jgi:hypothetical protein
MGSALLLLLLTADPTSAVVLARRTGVTQAESVAVTERVGQALLDQKVPGLLGLSETSARLAKVAMTDATMCNGKPACHAELARQLEVDWLVLVSVSQVAGEQSLAIELARGATGAVAENESLLLAQKGQVPMDTLQRFAERMTARLRGAPADAPKVTTLTPTPGEPPPTLPPEPKPEGKSRAPTIVLGAAGVAALGAGVALLVSGLGARGRLSAGETGPDGLTYSGLTGAEAQALNESANVQFAIAGAAAAVGLGLGAAAIATW